MAATTFTLPDLPGITFTVQRGADEDTPEVPSNWLTIVGIDNTTGEVVLNVGAAGP